MRLGAIDAPESSHLCLDAASNRSHCDQKLAITLDDLIGGSVIICGPTPQKPNSDAKDPLFDHAPKRLKLSAEGQVKNTKIKKSVALASLAF